MTSSARKPRLAVVSPSLDKRHGTERLVVEWISRLAPAFEIHIYSQRSRTSIFRWPPGIAFPKSRARTS